jgi:hypothetical protein
MNFSQTRILKINNLNNTRGALFAPCIIVKKGVFALSFKNIYVRLVVIYIIGVTIMYALCPKERISPVLNYVYVVAVIFIVLFLLFYSMTIISKLRRETGQEFRIYIPDNNYGIVSKYYSQNEITQLLRDFRKYPKIVQFIADMLEL